MSQTTLSSPVSGRRPGENTWLWLIKIATGPLLVLVIGLHFAVNHYMGSMSSGLMTYDDIIAYYQIPIIPIIEIVFLATVVTHSLIGLRGIILDLNPSRSVLKVVTWLMVILGVVSVGYGIWLVFAIASQGS
jgi:succinate dehydrogenase / fumarate reductase membrane anchor subunit